ncbi:MAG TPA: flagellar biosynthesis protein FlhB [Clostridiales bacterium]|nr:flagellar biosynthesis protein FlhB [Clostridiales bacterium]
MNGDDSQERREAPTPRRREDARRRGHVLRSQEVMGLAVLAIGVAVLRLTLPGMGGRLAHLAWSVWHEPPADELELGLLARMSGQALAGILLPLLAAAVLAAVGSGIAQTGGLTTPSLLAPDLKRLNPATGLGRMFSRRAVIELAKNLIKVGGATWAGWAAVGPRLPQLGNLAVISPVQAASTVAGWATILLWRMLMVLAVLAAVDYVFQRAEHEKGLRMTRREVLQELKESEGSPQVRARRLQVARSLRGQRLRNAVAGAQAVITNPDHFAVALRYTAGVDPAPMVAAKGRGQLALFIAGLARQMDIPVIHNRGLARALYHGVPVGAPVPGRLYQAVAAVMAYVYQLKGWKP